MKVCLSVGALGSGGIGLWAINLSHGLIELGLEVSLFLTTANSARLELVDDRIGIQIGGGRVLSSVYSLKRYLDQERPDILVSAHPHVACMGEICRRSAPARIRHVVTYHTHDLTDSSARGWRGTLLQRLGYWAASRADGIVAVSQGVANDLVRRFNWAAEHVVTIHNPAWTDRLAANALEPVEHKWLKRDRPWKTLVAIGRLTKQKDFGTLLQALQVVRRETDTRLIILGEGEERGRLRGLARKLEIESMVDMPGYVDNPVKYLNRADVFVLSSAWEGFGSVIVEALGAGVPVVATNCPSGPSEILENGKFGVLVPVGSVKDLASAILKQLGRRRNSEILLKRASDFHVSRIAREYVQYFSRL